MIPEAQVKHFLTHVAQGIRYHDQQHMWCSCFELYPGGEKAICTGGIL